MSNSRSIILSVLNMVIGVVLFIVSFGGLSLGLREVLVRGSSVRIERLGEPRPLRNIESIAVDSRGNIHFSLNQELLSNEGSVQVYDNEGNFLYGFSFPNWTGMILFYIDNDDVVHVLPVREGRVLSFSDGELIGYRERVIGAGENATTNYMRNLQNRTEFADRYGNQYRLSYSMTFHNDRIYNTNVRMYDTEGNFVREIIPNAPTWPLTLGGSLLMSITGIILTAIGTTFILKIIFPKLKNKRTLMSLFVASIEKQYQRPDDDDDM